jgi:hypothetical protein
MILFSGVPITQMQNPTWYEHVDIMQILIATLVIVVTWFITRTLRQIDTNQQALFLKLTELTDAFHLLKGEHDAIREICANRKG